MEAHRVWVAGVVSSNLTGQTSLPEHAVPSTPGWGRGGVGSCSPGVTLGLVAALHLVVGAQSDHLVEAVESLIDKMASTDPADEEVIARRLPGADLDDLEVVARCLGVERSASGAALGQLASQIADLPSAVPLDP